MVRVVLISGRDWGIPTWWIVATVDTEATVLNDTVI